MSAVLAFQVPPGKPVLRGIDHYWRVIRDLDGRGPWTLMDIRALTGGAVDLATIRDYRVSVSFSRSSDRYKDGYDNALKALRGLTAGEGALGVIGGDPTPGPAEDGTATADNGRVLMESNERLFTRSRTRGL